jgi:biotin carboxyl carrier protein
MVDPAPLGALTMGDETLVLRDDSGGEHRVRLAAGGMVTIGDTRLIVRTAPDGTRHVIDAMNSTAGNALAWAVTVDDTRWVFADGGVFTFEIERPSSRRRSAAHHGSLMSPMPATVRKVLVTAGDTVRKHDVLIVLEAMKMELPIKATADGRVGKISCREGDLVQPGVPLIELDEAVG